MLDCLIIGAGLAGCNLSLQLSMAGRSHMIISNSALPSSSGVAGGIYNPILPKHRKTAYNAALIYKIILQYYRDAETFLNAPFLQKEGIRYILQSQAEQNDWSAAAGDPTLSEWISVNDAPLLHLEAPYGYMDIMHSGWVQSNAFTEAVSSHMRNINAFTDAPFDYNALEIADDCITYGDIKARNIIFCEGNGAAQNPFIKQKFLNPAKGEILLVKTGFDIDYIATQGVFMLPQGDGAYRVGSTFTWDPLDNIPTETAKAEILHKWRFFYKGDYELIGHVAGVRPSSNDRRPVLGKIKPYNNVYIFNGLGAKGVALAPYYGQMLLKNIFENGVIDREADMARIR